MYLAQLQDNVLESKARECADYLNLEFSVHFTGLKNLEIVERENLVSNAKERGNQLFNRMSELKDKYKIIMWDVFSWDFKKNISHQKLYDNIIKNVDSGSIIVFHNNNKSADSLSKSLKSILVKLKDEGYSFSTTW